VPVIAFAEDIAASGGYWIACAADEIYADANSIIGSIGVIAATFGFPDLLRRLGVERRVYKAGDKKSMLDPFQPIDPDDVERLKTIQHQIHQNFQDWVRTRRGDRLKGLDSELFSGEFWTAERALELGLIDGIDDVRAAMRRRFGDQVRLRQIGAEPGWLRRMFRLPGRGEEEALAGPVSSTWAAGLLAALEERALWARFGL
jgi:ClpP class serine protease